jgi:hypothetical protein
MRSRPAKTTHAATTSARACILVVTQLALTATACGAPAGTAGHNLVRRNVSHIQTATSHEDRGRCDATQPGRNASEYDTNGDGVPDVRKVYQMIGEGAEVRSVLVCREVDLNHDGTKDMFRFYNDEGRTLREEEDRDFDGRSITMRPRELAALNRRFRALGNVSDSGAPGPFRDQERSCTGTSRKMQFLS